MAAGGSRPRILGCGQDVAARHNKTWGGEGPGAVPPSLPVGLQPRWSGALILVRPCVFPGPNEYTSRVYPEGRAGATLFDPISAP
jgi:hypothetical protein